MNYRKKQIFLLDLLYLAAWGLLLWLVIRYALRWLLPFLLAYLAAAALNRPVIWCQKKLRFQRGFSSAVFTVFFISLAIALLFILISTLLSEAYTILLQAPERFASLSAQIAPLQDTFRRLCGKCPPEIQEFLLSALTSFSRETGILLGRLSEGFLAACASLMQRLPGCFLFLITTVLAIFYTSSHFPQIRAFLLRQLPSSWKARAKEIRPRLFSAVLKWLKAELILVALTFFLLLAGFLLLRLRYAFFSAFLIALIDTLPILGVGTVLLPWALFSFLEGNILMGIALSALYLAVQLTRSLLEPRLIAAQGGLPAIAALLAMYVGFRFRGIAGMIFFPLLLLLLKQLHDEGHLKIWK